MAKYEVVVKETVYKFYRVDAASAEIARECYKDIRCFRGLSPYAPRSSEVESVLPLSEPEPEMPTTEDKVRHDAFEDARAGWREGDGDRYEVAR